MIGSVFLYWSLGNNWSCMHSLQNYAWPMTARKTKWKKREKNRLIFVQCLQASITTSPPRPTSPTSLSHPQIAGKCFRVIRCDCHVWGDLIRMWTFFLAPKVNSLAPQLFLAFTVVYPGNQIQRSKTAGGGGALRVVSSHLIVGAIAPPKTTPV